MMCLCKALAFDSGNVTPCMRYVERDPLYLVPRGSCSTSSAFPSLLCCWGGTEVMEKGQGSGPTLSGIYSEELT